MVQLSHTLLAVGVLALGAHVFIAAAGPSARLKPTNTLRFTDAPSVYSLEFNGFAAGEKLKIAFVEPLIAQGTPSPSEFFAWPTGGADVVTDGNGHAAVNATSEALWLLMVGIGLAASLGGVLWAPIPNTQTMRLKMRFTGANSGKSADMEILYDLTGMPTS